jgi:hypothetical protein
MVEGMATDTEVRDHIYAVLQDTEDFDTFEAWFVGETWDERTTLVIQVDHLMAEIADRSELLESLRRLVSVVIVGGVPDGGELSGPTFIEDLDFTRNRTVIQRLTFAGR